MHNLTLLGGRSEGKGPGAKGRSHARTGSAGFGHPQPANGEDYADQGITAKEIPF